MKRYVLLVALAIMLMGALPVAAQEYPPDGGAMVLLDANGSLTNLFAPGEIGEIQASGLLANTTYDVTFSQSPAERIGGGRTDVNGSLRATFRIPTDAVPGPATLTLDPLGVSGDNRSVGIRIVSSKVGVGAEFPRTGQPIDLYIGLGALLVVAGTVLLTFVWRRSRRGRSTGNGDREPATTKRAGQQSLR